jgi:hypothetical protein
MGKLRDVIAAAMKKAQLFSYDERHGGLCECCGIYPVSEARDAETPLSSNKEKLEVCRC